MQPQTSKRRPTLFPQTFIRDLVGVPLSEPAICFFKLTCALSAAYDWLIITKFMCCLSASGPDHNNHDSAPGHRWGRKSHTAPRLCVFAPKSLHHGNATERDDICQVSACDGEQYRVGLKNYVIWLDYTTTVVQQKSPRACNEAARTPRMQ